MKSSRVKSLARGTAAWLVALALFFPIFWMTLTAFKTERAAYSPALVFKPTLESFREVFARSNYTAFALNSVCISLGSTVLCFAAVCSYWAAWSLPCWWPGSASGSRWPCYPVAVLSGSSYPAARPLVPSVGAADPRT